MTHEKGILHVNGAYARSRHTRCLWTRQREETGSKEEISSSDQYTIAVGLYELVGEKFGAEFTKFAAGSVLIAIPITTLFLFFQKYFVSGLTAGSTKG